MVTPTKAILVANSLLLVTLILKGLLPSLLIAIISFPAKFISYDARYEPMRCSKDRHAADYDKQWYYWAVPVTDEANFIFIARTEKWVPGVVSWTAELHTPHTMKAQDWNTTAIPASHTCGTSKDQGSYLLGAGGNGVYSTHVQANLPNLTVDMTFAPLVQAKQNFGMMVDLFAPTSVLGMRWFCRGMRLRYNATIRWGDLEYKGVFVGGYAEHFVGKWAVKGNNSGIKDWLFYEAFDMKCISGECQSKSLAFAGGGTMLKVLRFAYISDENGRFADTTWVATAVNKHHNATYAYLGLEFSSLTWRATLDIDLPYKNLQPDVRARMPHVLLCKGCTMRLTLQPIWGLRRRTETYMATSTEMEIQSSYVYGDSPPPQDDPMMWAKLASSIQHDYVEGDSPSRMLV